MSSSSDSLDSTYSLNEFTGSEYRKVSVTGRPMPDTKPQREGETDYTREETYVDALTLDLQHDVTDLFIPLASDQLTLSVRRSLTQAAYGVEVGDFKNPNSGLLNASQAFGACWRSGLDCGLQIVTAYHYDSSKNVKFVDAGYRQIVLVTDENGQLYRFAILSDGKFLPLPSASVSIDVANISLSTNSAGEYVFTRRYGNEIVFDGVPALIEGSDTIQVEHNALGEATQVRIGDHFAFRVASTNVWSSAGFTNSYSRVERSGTSATNSAVENYERRERYRPQFVKDRYGNRLVYTFPEQSSSLIPAQVTALHSTQTVSGCRILISENNGLVSSVTDPEGNTVSYSYTRSQANAFATNGLPQLVQVSRSSSPVAVYSYTEQTFNKYYGSYNWSWSYSGAYGSSGGAGGGYFSVDYHHLALSSVTDANGNRYDFGWTANNSARSLEYWNTTTYHTTNPDEEAPEPATLSFEELLAATNIQWRIGSNEAQPLQISAITQGVHVARFNIIQTIELDTNSPRTVISDWQQMQVCDMSGKNWTYVFMDADITRSLDRPALGTVENEGISKDSSDALLFKTMVIQDHHTGYEAFYFDPNAGMALREAADYFGNPTVFGHGDTNNFEKLGSSANEAYTKTHLATYQRRPTAQTNALSKVRNYAYGSYNQKKSISDEFSRNTEFQFDDFGNRTNAIQRSTNGTVIALTEMTYTNAAFPNFMTGKIVRDMNDTNDPAWVGDLVTVYEPHEYGQVGRKIVDPNGLNLTTVYDYDKNNNLTKVIDPNGNMTTNGYDSMNRLVHIAFFDGITTLKSTKHFWYDPRSNKTWERDENGNYSYFEYDSRNNCTKTVRIMGDCSDPANGTQSYNPSADDIVTTSEYNAMGGLAATVDPRGLRTEFQYDHIQRLTNTIIGAGLSPTEQQITAYGYDGENCGSLIFNTEGFKPVTVKDPRGYVTTTVYDELHRPVEIRREVTSGVEAVTYNTYDDVGNLTVVSNQVSDGVWQVTQTIYDEQDRPVRVINPDGTTNEFRYTSTGLKWASIDALSRTNSIEYDAAGRPVKTVSPYLAWEATCAVTETGYDSNGNVKWVKDARGNVTTNVYDFRNRLVQTIAPSVYDAEHGITARPVVSSLYDAVSNVVSVTDARGKTVTNIYDRAGRLTVTRAPEVNVYGETNPVRPATTNVYDKGGNIVATIDANGRTVQMQYDVFGRLTNTVDAVTNTISFEYDKNGNQTALIDGNGSRTEFVYDGLNRKVGTVYPAAGGTSTREDAEYDLIGNRIKRIDCNGSVTEYFYDDRNRLLHVDYQSGQTRDYQYDLVGNLTNVTESADASARVAYVYDELNRVVRETSAGVTHQYYYDLNGNRTDAAYGVTGRQIRWNYDALNRLSEILVGDEEEQDYDVTEYKYDLNSKPVYRKYSTGVEELRTFDAMGRLLTMTTTNSANGESFAMAYQYDGVGSAREMVQSSWNLSGKAQDAVTKWSYDSRYRLTNETVITGSGGSGSTSTVSYAWDSADNRLSKTVTVSTNGTFLTTSTIVYTNNALNQMLGYTEVASASSVTSVVNFAYDVNGARTNKAVTVNGTDTAATAYIYDGDNRLISTADRAVQTNECSACDGSTWTCSTCRAYDWGHCIVCGAAYGSCVACFGSGLEDSQPGTICPGCEGTGICGTCNGSSLCQTCLGDGDCTDCVSGSVVVSVDQNVHTFKYDYRSRRYYRSTPTETNLCVFDGGLSIQEYALDPNNQYPTTNNLRTEYVRGEGMGGGVGGMVYSITTNGIKCSHANHRGDVIARSGSNGSLTSFALYEAYGTRPYEWGSDSDRQKANTKEEEKDLGLLNEGMRYRDLETGTFLTRDPIGFKDGPNVYCYVHCNPITSFDPFGLKMNEYAGANPQPYTQVTIDDMMRTQGGYDYADSYAGFCGGKIQFRGVDWFPSNGQITYKISGGLEVRIGILDSLMNGKSVLPQGKGILNHERGHEDIYKEMYTEVSERINRIENLKFGDLSSSQAKSVGKDIEKYMIHESEYFNEYSLRKNTLYDKLQDNQISQEEFDRAIEKLKEEMEKARKELEEEYEKIAEKASEEAREAQEKARQEAESARTSGE